MSQSLFVRIKGLLEKRPAAVALFAGLSAALLASGYLSRREAEMLRIAEPVHVVVASQDIGAGLAIDEENVAAADVPRRFVTPGALGSVEEASGRVAMVSIAKGTQLNHAIARFSGKGSGVSSLLPAGMRAFSIAVPRSGAAAGLVSPGDHIDVLATFDLGDRSSSQMTTLSIVKGVRVLAVEKSIAGAPLEDSKTNSKQGIFSGAMGQGQGAREISVTLAVNLEEAQALAFAQQAGALALAIRPPDDADQDGGVSPTTISTIVEGAGGLSPMRKPFKEYRGAR
ncbi:MAG: Flp pilus assembly protein CpaB [bacterium]